MNNHINHSIRILNTLIYNKFCNKQKKIDSPLVLQQAVNQINIKCQKSIFSPNFLTY